MGDGDGLSGEETTMSLKDYLDAARGFGVLATASADGSVDVAVYARPHVVDEETVAFIMADRLSHKNLQSNPRATYLFREGTGGYTGKRLHLTKVSETTDAAAIQALRRRKTPIACEPGEGEVRHLVTFHVDRVRPLVGD
jgi:hypothetical protein